jgi:hypothetical protein
MVRWSRFGYNIVYSFNYSNNEAQPLESISVQNFFVHYMLTVSGIKLVGSRPVVQPIDMDQLVGQSFCKLANINYFAKSVKMVEMVWTGIQGRNHRCLPRVI